MDRTVSMILQTASIREVIAFPKNRSAACPLTGAPSAVKREQLAELGLLNLGEKDVLPGTAHKENLLDSVSWVARLGIAEAERSVMEDILKQAEELAGQVRDLAGSEEPMRSVVRAAGKTRPGTEATRSPLAETGQLLKSAPAVKGNYFKVANIIE
jgi:aspartyl-tRNA synthetase